MMARKALRNLALLGGLGAAAAMAMRGKGKEEESKDTTGDASAGMAKDKLSDFRGKSGDADKDVGPAMKRATAPAAKPAAPAAKPAAPSRMTGGKSGDADKDIGIGTSRMTEMNKRKPIAAQAVERFKAAREAPLGQMSDVVGAKKGGMIGSASKRADGCAMRGKTKGRMV
jgi:hypothetical protein